MSDEESRTGRFVESGKDIYGKAKGIAVDKTKGGPTEMFVVAFDGVGQADEVLGTLKKLDDGRLVELGKAAVIRRGVDGVIDIEETADMDTKESAIAGAVAGGLLGMLTGRGLIGGALLGAGGGALASKGLDLGFDDDFLNEFGEKLGPDSSAIVATVEFTNVEAAMEVLDRFEGGTILRTTLQPEIAAQLSDAVED
jgi:uncharacterized membrane protein